MKMTGELKDHIDAEERRSGEKKPHELISTCSIKMIRQKIMNEPSWEDSRGRVTENRPNAVKLRNSSSA